MSNKNKDEKLFEQIKNSFNTNIRDNKSSLLRFLICITLILIFTLGRYSVSIDKNIVCKSEIRKEFICKSENEVLIKEKELLQNQVASVIKERADYARHIIEEFEKDKDRECTQKIEKIKKEYIKLKCSICK